MKYTVEFIPAGNLVRITGIGKVTREAIRRFHREYLDHEEWVPGTHVLIDFRRVDMSEFGASDIQFISNLVVNSSEEIGGGKMAILISRNNEFGLARMWEMKTDAFVDFRINVFMDETEALEWLRQEEHPEDEDEL